MLRPSWTLSACSITELLACRLGSLGKYVGLTERQKSLRLLRSCTHYPLTSTWPQSSGDLGPFDAEFSGYLHSGSANPRPTGRSNPMQVIWAARIARSMSSAPVPVIQGPGASDRQLSTGAGPRALTVSAVCLLGPSVGASGAFVRVASSDSIGQVSDTLGSKFQDS